MLEKARHNIKWDKVFKNGPSKICGRQPLKGCGLLKAGHIRSNILKAIFYKFNWSILEYFDPHDNLVKVILIKKRFFWFSNKPEGGKGRSSRPEVFCKKGVLSNFTKFTGKNLCQGLFFNKVADLRPANLLKKRVWHRCFPVN